VTAATQIQDIRFRPLGRGTFVGGIFVTLLLHAALGVLMWWSNVHEAPPAEKEREIVLTEMVKLGKPREKFWLPRIVEAPPPPPVEQVIKVAEDPNAAPTPKEEKPPEKPPEKKELSKKVEDVLKRRKFVQEGLTEDQEGLPTGTARGTSNVQTEGDPYFSMIRDRIQQNWNVPQGLTLGQVLNLETKVRIKLGDDGSLLDPRVVKSSGNQMFDDTCIQAIQATRKVDPPPPEKRAMARGGLVFLMEGKDLAR